MSFNDLMDCSGIMSLYEKIAEMGERNKPPIFSITCSFTYLCMTGERVKSISKEKLLSIASLLLLIPFVPFFTMDPSPALNQKMVLIACFVSSRPCFSSLSLAWAWIPFKSVYSSTFFTRAHPPPPYPLCPSNIHTLPDNRLTFPKFTPYPLFSQADTPASLSAFSPFPCLHRIPFYPLTTPVLCSINAPFSDPSSAQKSAFIAFQLTCDSLNQPFLPVSRRHKTSVAGANQSIGDRVK